MYKLRILWYSSTRKDETTRGLLMAIETVEDAQYELQVALEETLADFGDDAPDEGSAASDLFVSMSWDWPADVAAEVARREFGWCPFGTPQAVVDAFAKIDGAGEW